MRRNETTKSLRDGFVLKTLTDLKWEKAKADLEMKELEKKYAKLGHQSLYYYRKKLERAAKINN